MLLPLAPTTKVEFNLNAAVVWEKQKGDIIEEKRETIRSGQWPQPY